MSKTLVIVESPTKAKKIGEFLGSGFTVLSSYGHIRDLPKGKLGVDIANDFAPQYVIPPDDQRHVTELQRAAASANEVILATDEDREGEAIAWHLAEALKLPPEKTKRIVFHEITKSAIAAALAHPRSIDQRLVDAQQSRRILDRLVGYTLSPFLWRKVAGGLSAGRVQSVAVRILVDREREVRAFQPEEYWTVEAALQTPSPSPAKGGQALPSQGEGEKNNNFPPSREGGRGGEGTIFSAFLKQRDGKKYVPKNADEANAVVAACEGAAWTVANVEEKELRRTPPAPFTTSTLQQEASRKLGFSVKQTMTLAQRLYENGYITYMRTDSVALASEALDMIRRQVREQFGTPYALPNARAYATKSKGAQEAHEAIRPTDPTRTPTSLTSELEDGQRRLYELIWLRTMATQMPDAQLKRVGVDVEARTGTRAGGKTSGVGGKTPDVEEPAAKRVRQTYTFRATGQTITFDGFLRVYQEGRDEEREREPGQEQGQEEGEKILPPLVAGEACTLRELKPEQHFTKPPPRYTEASLVKKLEEEGIGRPSTYAPTISTVIARGYIRKEGRQLIPEEVAFLVIDLLKEHFTNIVDLKFTAKMEEDLDDIAEGKQDDGAFLKGFWEPFDAQVKQKATDLTKADVMQERVLGKDPATGLDVLVRSGRFGPYIQLGRLEDMAEIPPKRKGGKPKKEKPKHASLSKDTNRDAVTLEQALALLAFPRVLGTHEGNEVTANLGRFGPYVKCGDMNASIPEGTDPTAITLEQALALCTERKEQKRKAAEPLRVLGMSTDTNTEIVIKAGRFGPFVTDGTTLASVPKSSSVEAITLEEAVELLAKKRARGNGRHR
ncbi:type I DNA topoisomerase [Candidatus Uhrbacteria bacterium]|nr:type I DNA topoisomerase [Candidatus Uhrbacteria bacterium]